MPPAKQIDSIICTSPVLEALYSNGPVFPLPPVVSFVPMASHNLQSTSQNVYNFLLYLLSNHLSIIIFFYEIIIVL